MKENVTPACGEVCVVPFPGVIFIPREKAAVKKFCLLLLLLLCLPVSGVSAAVMNKIAAVVNGQVITMYDLQEAVAPELAQRKISSQSGEGQQLLRQTLDNMIMDILVLQEAERQKVTVTDAEVDGEIAQMIQQSGLNNAAFEQRLQGEGLTRAKLQERIRKNIIRQKLMGMMVSRKVVVSKEEIEAYYNAHRSEFPAPRTVYMAILVYPKNADAQAWAKKISSGAVSFEQVVQQLSVGPNKANGGRVEPVKEDKMSPQWRQLLAGMKPGDVTPLLPLRDNMVQVKFLNAESSGDLLSFEEARPLVENVVREPRLQERFMEYKEQLRKRAVIDVRI